MSQIEMRVAQILNDGAIPYEREKCFKDCYNGRYRFDFYCPTRGCVIEVNGEQHYKEVGFYKTHTEFTQAQERDRRKIGYCLANGIEIYCIPYWEVTNLVDITDLFDQKFRATSKFHNDIVARQQKL